ncbi:MAG: hypothetical protein R2831_09365 [Chitinophagaceae bacterium]
MDNKINSIEIEMGKPLGNWEIERIFDKEVPHIQDFQGKALLILIFSFGCPGCIGRAIPFANRMVLENAEKMNVIGIHTNFEGVDFERNHFQNKINEFYIRFEIYKDKNYNTTFLNYGAGGTPHWILVDKKGIMKYSIFGSDPNNALLRLSYKIHEILDEN